MKGWAQKPIDGAQQFQAWVQDAAESGIAASRSMLGTLPFCTSLISSSKGQDGDVQEDLIHYFLIPCGIDDSGYTLFAKRQLPEGVGTENDLPKFSVFHLPNSGAAQKLEALILANLSKEARDASAVEGESIDERLERIANEIEKHSNYVTGGILLIGGIVAVANPLLGVGIAAKALFPSIGAKVSSEAMKLGGGKLRQWRERGEQKRSEKQAKAELKQRKARVVINPFLAKLQRAIDTDEAQFDPGMEDPFLTDQQDLHEGVRAVTLEVLAEYGAQVRSVTEKGRLGPEDLRWLHMLNRYADAM